MKTPVFPTIPYWQYIFPYKTIPYCPKSYIVHIYSHIKQSHIAHMLRRSLPMIRFDIGAFSAATWSQPPGAAHRSIITFDRCKNSNFLFS